MDILCDDHFPPLCTGRHPDGNLNVNVSVTVSPLAADFTSITSFGRPGETCALG